MKSFFTIFSALLTFSSMATVDSNTTVYILAQHVQTGEYFVQQAPIVGCYGLPRGPQFVMLTREYVVPSNVGCGGSFNDNLNVLTCAKVVDSKESADYATYSAITLDISKCEDKDNQDFINGIKKVIKMNFATNVVKEINLKLIK